MMMIKKLIKLLLAPIKWLIKKIKNTLTFIKNLIGSIFKKKKKKNKRLETLEDLTERFFDKYHTDIMFKLELGTNGEKLEIYSQNFKTTLDKPKKGKKSELIETEVVEKWI